MRVQELRRHTTKRLIGVLGVWCICALPLVACTKPTGPTWVAHSLVYAFLDADLQAAKAVTVPEQWDRIEVLMEGRQPFTCRGGDWETSGIQSVSRDISDSEMNYGLEYRCVSQTTPYCLAVDDMILKKIGDNWVVYDWGTMREAHSYIYPCGEQ
jgi:hypothetical protein